MTKTNILLLTNRDSDNVGDQLIEASVISLIQGVMQNLEIPRSEYSIESRAAGIISKKYMKTRDPALLETARELISRADLVVFGGAPLFNYAYQSFYLRTIKTIELAEEYGVPVIFSSIGVEEFDPENPKCIQLKKALASPCVKQITTRDDFESLQKYVEGTDTPIAHVSDPVVLADIVFRKRPAPASPPAPAQPPAPITFRGRVIDVLRKVPAPAPLRSRVGALLRGPQPVKQEAELPKAAAPTAPGPVVVPQNDRKKIGLVAVREGIFADNRINFSEEEQRQFWRDAMNVLTERGYDVRLFTTGHFSDEVFLDAFVRDDGIPASQAAIVVNTPEGLMGELKACDGVIAFRLHASITSYALGIPSVGLSWNFKVPYFYESIGYAERAIEPSRWNVEEVIPALEAAMAEGIDKDQKFLTSVYDTLFSGLKGVFAPESNVQPYSYAQLKRKLPRYKGTSARAYQVKARRKMRRTYENYQKLALASKKNAS